MLGFGCDLSVHFTVTVAVTASIRVRVCTGITVTITVRVDVLLLSALFGQIRLFQTSGQRLGERLRGCQYVCLCDC